MNSPRQHPSQGISTAQCSWWLISARIDVFGESFPVPPFAVFAPDELWALLMAGGVLPAEQIIPDSLKARPLASTVVGLAGIPADPPDDDCPPHGIPRPVVPPDDDRSGALALTIAGHEDRGTAHRKETR